MIEHALTKPIVYKRIPNPTYSISSIGGCPKKLFYKRQQMPMFESISFELECYFEIGNTVHDIVQKRLKLAYPQWEMEFNVAPIEVSGAPVTMRPDILMFNQKHPDIDQVGEIKVLGRSTFGGKPKEQYKIQLATACHALGISRGSFFFVERDRIIKRTIPMLEDEIQEHWERAEAIINEIEGYLSSGKEYPRPVDRSRRFCESCGYYYLCWNEGIEPQVTEIPEELAK